MAANEICIPLGHWSEYIVSFASIGFWTMSSSVILLQRVTNVIRSLLFKSAASRFNFSILGVRLLTKKAVSSSVILAYCAERTFEKFASLNSTQLRIIFLIDSKLIKHFLKSNVVND